MCLSYTVCMLYQLLPYSRLFQAVAKLTLRYQKVHGVYGDTPDAEVSSNIRLGVAAMSSWECSPTPPYQPFENILYPLDSNLTISENTTFTTRSLGLDRFPNQTE